MTFLQRIKTFLAVTLKNQILQMFLFHKRKIIYSHKRTKDLTKLTKHTCCQLPVITARRCPSWQICGGRSLYSIIQTKRTPITQAQSTTHPKLHSILSNLDTYWCKQLAMQKNPEMQTNTSWPLYDFWNANKGSLFMWSVSQIIFVFHLLGQGIGCEFLIKQKLASQINV